jgi:hypothetical protein
VSGVVLGEHLRDQPGEEHVVQRRAERVQNRRESLSNRIGCL